MSFEFKINLKIVGNKYEFLIICKLKNSNYRVHGMLKNCFGFETITFGTSIYIYIYIYKYYERKKRRNYISRQACFVNRFTLQGFNGLRLIHLD